MASERSTMRYEAAVATFIGILALMVSAYTAYMQRQQVRAQVLDECWTLRDMPDSPASTTETRRCPTASARTFKQ